MKIIVDNSVSVAGNIDSNVYKLLHDNMSVKDDSKSFVIKRHYKEVHPWICKECDFRQARTVGDATAQRMCVRCGGVMRGHQHWCDICNKEDGNVIISPLEMRGKDLYIPTGLVRRVIHILSKNNISHELDMRNTRPEPNPVNINVVLRDYQMTIYDSATSTTRGMWESPTGSGKTITALSIWSYWGCKGIILVPTEDIQLQFYNEAENMFDREVFDSIGLIGGHAKKLKGDHWSPSHTLSICLYQTMWSKKRRSAVDELLNDIDFILADEHHHAASDKMYDMMVRSNAGIKYGQSATLYHNKLGTLYLEACTGPVIARVSDDKLTNDGWKARPIVKIAEVDGIYSDDFEESREINIYKNVGVLEATYDAVISHEGLILALTNRKDHMRAIYTYLKNRGVNVKMVSGDSDNQERLDTISEMRDGSLDCVVATQVFDEGIDIPGAVGVVLAGGGISPIKHKQRIGRALRPKKGENVAYIYDIVIDDMSYMRKHSNIRCNRYKSWDWQIDRIEKKYSALDDYDTVFTDREREFINNASS